MIRLVTLKSPNSIKDFGEGWDINEEFWLWLFLFSVQTTLLNLLAFENGFSELVPRY